MALDQFKPEIFAKKIEQELEKALVAREGCNLEYQGDVANAGDSVRIMQLARPTTTTTTDGAPITISSFEALSDSSQTMTILQQTYFAQVLNKSDLAQSVDGVLEKVAVGGAYEIADDIDAHILSVASAATKVPTSAVKIDASNVLSKIDDCLEALYKNNVKPSAEIEIIITPRAYKLFRQAYQTLDTNNSGMLKNGQVGTYNGAIVRMSNNITTANTGLEDLCIVRTKRAVAFVEQINDTEVLPRYDGFGKVVKGLALYQAKIVQPNEIVVLNVKYA